jgi:pimeloyl-ACP methyl ester carboxylesterase
MATEVTRHLLGTRFGQLHYWIAGSGPDLFLLHQSAQSADEYLPIAPLLAESFRVISLDLPGHGASDTPDHELGVEEYCEAATAVLDELKVTRTHVLGHHGGCMLAVQLAVQDASRFDRLVLSGGGITDPDIVDLLLNNPMTRDLPVDTGGEFLQKTWSVYKRMSAPETSPETTFLPFVTGLRARLRPYDMHYEVLRWDYEASWRQLRHTTLLIKAEYDHFSGDVAGLHDELPDSQFLELPDCGPWLFYEQPAAIASAVTEFLR